jgi:LuxR family transcriptional regulator, transcriptional regulator of spore coat protein
MSAKPRASSDKLAGQVRLVTQIGGASSASYAKPPAGLLAKTLTRSVNPPPPTEPPADGGPFLPAIGEGRTFENDPPKTWGLYLGRPDDRLGPMERGMLSPRELDALTWAAKGKTYWETARILGIAYASVHSHINSLKLKLNAVNVTHAVARGYELGLIELRTAEPRVMMLTGQRPDASALIRDRRIVVSENLPV